MPTKNRFALTLVAVALAIAAAVTWLWAAHRDAGIELEPTHSTLPVEEGARSASLNHISAAAELQGDSPASLHASTPGGDSSAASPERRAVAVDTAWEFGEPTFAELVSVYEGRDGPTLADFDVLCLASDGSLRVSASGGAVAPRDFDVQGLLILRAPGMCPRWLDPAVLKDRLAAGETEPLRLMLIPSATVIVKCTSAPLDAAPITRLELRSADAFHLGRAFLGPTDRSVKGAYDVYDSFAAEAARWRALVDVELADTARASLLQLCRASSPFAEIAIDVDPGTFRYLLPWLARLETASAEAGATFENVPAMARVNLFAISDDVLDHDGALDLIKRRQQGYGGCAMGPLTLGPGEVHVWNVHHIHTGAVCGRLPPSAVRDIDISLTLVDKFERGRVTMSTGVYLVPDATTRAFNAEHVLPGHYRLDASWQTTLGASLGCNAEFDVAPGESVDLGELVADSHTLNIVARLSVDAETVANGAPIDLSLLVCLARVGGGTFSGRDADVYYWLTPGEPLTVMDLQAGDVMATPLAVCTRAEAVERASDYARRHKLGGATPVRATGSLVLTGASYAKLAKIPATDDLVLDFVVAASAQLDLDVMVPKLFARAGAITNCWMVRGSGSDTHKQRLVEWRGEPSGGGFLSGTATLPAGSWTVIVQLTLPPPSDAPQVAVGIATVVLLPGARREITLELVEAATLRFGADANLSPSQSDALLLVDLPDWQYTPFAVVRTASGALATGLLPNTSFDVPLQRGGSRVVVTGAPGSTVEAP